jgi:N-acetylglucosamine-6-sulfatase
MGRGPILAAAAAVVALMLAGCGGEREADAEATPPADAGVASSGAPAPEDRRPNIVVVMTDDQDLFSLRVMRTVRRAIARRGITFPSYYNTDPLCCPSRATFLTGQYAHNHGTLSNRGPEGGFVGFDDRGTVPIALKRSGYRTGFVGKYLNGYGPLAVRDPELIPRGWSSWDGLVTGRMFNWIVNRNGELHQFRGLPHYQTDGLGALAAKFIRKSATDRRHRPFFLTVWPHAAHRESGNLKLPVNPRSARRHAGAFKGAGLPDVPSFRERDFSDKPSFVRRHAAHLDKAKRRRLIELNRARLASLLAVDDLVGRLVRTLRESGELGETYLFFTTDNGYMLGAHGLKAKPFPYEENVRFPLLVRGPGIPAGKRRPQLVGNVDLAPTILDLAKVEPLRPPDGASLLPLVRGRGADGRHALLLESFTTRFAGVHTKRWVYVEHDVDDDGDADEFELYDLVRDPYQLENMLRSRTGELRRADPAAESGLANLRARLASLRDCAGASCR